ncbi:patatin-like phospholipase family protein [Brevundimonas sp.]|uniref:patatin-like phospholipase family protein n=1 Tax=Brevundimonas sp. TaxID=1871086 RepID=UPI0026062330|nr:patatin-like phospholipase family protein [Brevundimonas sp.]
MTTGRRDTLDAALHDLFEGQASSRASWFALTGGERLFAEGDPADTLYLLRSGRLGVFGMEGGASQFLGVIRPGEPAGEMAMLAGTAHTAEVVALRDSEILALPREAFFEAARTHPDLMVELARLMIRRARDQQSAAGEPSVFGFISARPRPIRAFVERLAAAIQAMGFSCRVVDHSALSSVADWFTRVEDAHDYVLYVAESDEPAWAGLCARQVDRLFVVGDPLLAPDISRLPQNPQLEARRRTDLLLLRDPRMPRPANTPVWLQAVKPGRWFHAQDGDAMDAERMARVVTATSVGLVLSGGGARAYAHVGAIHALRMAGVPFDFLGGASMGAIVAAGPALGWSQSELEARLRHAFVESDPLSDLAFPIVAMTRSRKVERLLEETYGDIDIANMPLPYFAVSTNLTRGGVEVHRQGQLRGALRATISIPGVMPPVVRDGQVLVDGAVIDNFPTAVMRQFNAGPIVGVDMSQARGVDPQGLKNPPSWWGWFASGAWKRGPPIVSVLMRAATLTTDAELEHARARADLLIQPRPENMDIRDWKAFEPAVEAGRRAATAALEGLDRPVTHLRRTGVRGDAPPETDAETATGPRRPAAGGSRRAKLRPAATETPS